MPLFLNFNKNDLIFLAECCKQTYQQYENDGEFTIPSGYKLVKTFKGKINDFSEWFGFIIMSYGNIIIAFRGSSSILDWLADANILQEPFPYYPKKIKTHSGFTNIYESCRKELITTLNLLNPSLNLIITGHSLGGALATLCSLDIAINTPFRRPLMVNFGSPRVGAPSFATSYNYHVIRSIRIANVSDIVTKLPPPIIRPLITKNALLNKHVKNKLLVKGASKDIFESHSLDSYIEILSSLKPCRRKPSFKLCN